MVGFLPPPLIKILFHTEALNRPTLFIGSPSAQKVSRGGLGSDDFAIRQRLLKLSNGLRGDFETVQLKLFELLFPRRNRIRH